ncbi:hypothetical protein QI633_26520 [Nocardioides sp. QY071]|uniref:hypothetical protein n=1 Tax=Nocardioides sp. QY071 TaxID=3044187 RepID=UPI00249C7A95|nr:hypothetical protein [Nocardioides sp. QY071]WGY02074.1 hypothetical protein QI633_26520 [Nocardioides sp. QY071]
MGPDPRTLEQHPTDRRATLVAHRGARVAERVGFWVDEPREVVRLLASSVGSTGVR